MSLRWEPTAEDRAFERVYGPWQPLTPSQARDLMAGFRPPWWVVGGWAVEAFTGVRRAHEDLDLVVFTTDFADLREHLSGRHGLHLWCNDGGTFRFVDDRHPDLLSPLCQVWVRRDATSPWLLDIPLNPVQDGRWVSRRDPALVRDLEEVTWVAGDGVRYLAPEMVLHHKARLRRPKDEVDLEAAWPLMAPAGRAWLLEWLRGADPTHPWLTRLG